MLRNINHISNSIDQIIKKRDMPQIWIIITNWFLVWSWGDWNYRTPTVSKLHLFIRSVKYPLCLLFTEISPYANVWYYICTSVNSNNDKLVITNYRLYNCEDWRGVHDNRMFIESTGTSLISNWKWVSFGTQLYASKLNRLS